MAVPFRALQRAPEVNTRSSPSPGPALTHLPWVRTLYKLEIHVHWAHSDEVSLAFASLISLKCVSMGIWKEWKK